MMNRHFAASALFFATVVGAQAAPAAEPSELTAEKLRSFCSSPDADLRKMCSIYIFGVAQGLGLGGDPAVNPRASCPRDDLNETELTDAFMRLSGVLKATYPDDLKAPAVSIVAATIAKSFPCNGARAKTKR